MVSRCTSHSRAFCTTAHLVDEFHEFLSTDLFLIHQHFGQLIQQEHVVSQPQFEATCYHLTHLFDVSENVTQADVHQNWNWAQTVSVKALVKWRFFHENGGEKRQNTSSACRIYIDRFRVSCFNASKEEQQEFIKLMVCIQNPKLEHLLRPRTPKGEDTSLCHGKIKRI